MTVLLFGPLLAACGAGSVLPGSGADASITNPTATVPTKPRIAVVPVIGAPAGVSANMTAGIIKSIEQQSFPVAKAAGEPVDYTLRGYVVAAPEKNGTKLSYIWDVLDKAGKRTHRITGEDVVPGKPPKDPWSVVDAATIDRIAGKTASQLSAWAPSTSPAPTLVSDGGKASGADASVTPEKASVSKGSEPLLAGEVVTTKPTVASLTTGPVPLRVYPVTGATGDGERSLAEALQRQLAAKGYSIATDAKSPAYAIRGKVTTTPSADGMQQVKIVWVVMDPAEATVGYVKLTNKGVPLGALDGAWGRTAEAAVTKAMPDFLGLFAKHKDQLLMR